MRDSKGSSQTPLLPKALEPAQDEASNAIPFIMYYALCSGTMLVINKLAIYYTQSPTFLLLCQLAFTAFVVQLLAVLGFVKSDHLEWDKTKKFIPVAMGFAASVFANMKVLQYANVDTFITFRSSTPLILSICDYLFLGRQLPSLRSWLCLLTLLISSVGYVMVDSAFEVRAYIWLLVWYAAFTFDGVYVKHLCNTVKMTDWGRVYYTNLLSLVPLVILYVGLKEYIILEHITWQGPQLLWLVVACILGVAMSHSGYCLRRSVTATMMALVGIICKVLTVVINCTIWDKHASPMGLFFLALSLAAGTFYEQAPPRAKSAVDPLTVITVELDKARLINGDKLSDDSGDLPAILTTRDAKPAGYKSSPDNGKVVARHSAHPN